MMILSVKDESSFWFSGTCTISFVVFGSQLCAKSDVLSYKMVAYLQDNKEPFMYSEKTDSR